MSISEIKRKAREDLKGNWGTAALMVLCFYGVIYAANFIAGLSGGFLSIAVTICTVPLEFGLVCTFLKLIKKEEETNVGEIFSVGFKNFGRSWGVVGNTLLKIWVPILVLVISIVVSIIGIIVTSVGAAQDEEVVALIGALIIVIAAIVYMVSIIWMCIKQLLYVLAQVIACDNPEMETKAVVEESAKLMKGNRLRYIGFSLSFVGWAILATLTLGIGFLWLMPYIQVSTIEFYKDLKEKIAE